MTPDGKSYCLLLVYACVPGRSLISMFFLCNYLRRLTAVPVSYGYFCTTNSNKNHVNGYIKLILPVV